MTVTSWKSASSAASVAGIGTVDWTNPTNCHVDDTSYAAANSMTASAVSKWLRAYFAFTSSDVPSGATIDGIEVETIVYGVNTVLIKTNAMRLVVGGIINGTNVSGMDTTNWGTTGSFAEETKTYGGAANLWNASPSQSDVTGASFGCAISAVNYEATKSRNAQLDYMRMRIYYTFIEDGSGGANGGRRSQGVPWMARTWHPIPNFVRRNQILVPAWI